jgi:hypothetical protein
MNKLLPKLIVAVLFAASVARADDKTNTNLVALKTDLPKPQFVGTPVPIDVPNLEPKLTGKRPDFMVPLGTTNLAKGMKVTASDSDPVVGTLDLVTDGDKEGDEGSWVELAPGKQWVQIDLAKEADIYAIIVWHFHSQERVYHDMVVQVSDDPAFGKDVKTVYDNSAAGTDHPYIETYQGKLIDTKGVKARYVRLYSKGSTESRLNEYTEVEVYGRPAK